MLWFIAVQLTRLSIAFALLYGGSLFLAFEVNMADLLLNTVRAPVHPVEAGYLPFCGDKQVALQFVLDLDEAFLRAFAPRTCVRFVRVIPSSNQKRCSL